MLLRARRKIVYANWSLFSTVFACMFRESRQDNCWGDSVTCEPFRVTFQCKLKTTTEEIRNRFADFVTNLQTVFMSDISRDAFATATSPTDSHRQNIPCTKSAKEVSTFLRHILHIRFLIRHIVFFGRSICLQISTIVTEQVVFRKWPIFHNWLSW